MPLLVNTLPPAVVPQLLVALGELLPGTPHLEYLLTWARAVCTRHGPAVQAGTLGGECVRVCVRGGPDGWVRGWRAGVKGSCCRPGSGQ